MITDVNEPRSGDDEPEGREGRYRERGDEPEAWSIATEPDGRHHGNADDWIWTLRRGEETATVTVRISATAMATSSEALPDLVVASRDSQGRSVLGRVLAVVAGWDEEELPRRIELSTSTVYPLVAAADGTELPGFRC